MTGGDDVNNIGLISWLRVNAVRQHDYLYNDKSTSAHNLITYICNKLSIQPTDISTIRLGSTIPSSYTTAFSVGASDNKGRILNE